MHNASVKTARGAAQPLPQRASLSMLPSEKSPLPLREQSHRSRYLSNNHGALVSPPVPPHRAHRVKELSKHGD